MKKMRKIVPAFAMLMVAAIMLSTASFAWFSTSATVEASGMSVKAQAATGLIMSALMNGSNGTTPPTTSDYGTSVNVTNPKWYTNLAATEGNVQVISPASTDDGVWYTASAAGADSATAKDGTYKTDADAGVEANGDLYLATKFYFMGLTETAQNLTINSINITATNTNGGTDLNKALRVALNVEGTWFYFAPFYTEAPTGGLVHTTSTTEDGTTTYDTEAYTPTYGQTFTPVVLNGNLNSAAPITAEVYIYFEGEDPNCRAALAFDLSTLDITMTFGSADKTNTD